MQLLFIATLTACLKTSAPLETDLRKSPNDHREYRTFVLDNGMRALVISDPETEMSAAALSVHVGQFHDPIDRQGLAHFLEHMLFLGSEKYPIVGDYRKFIMGNGGRSNAGTGQENTTYHFQITPNHLDEALDRFSQFFTSPSFNPEFVKREREAVHSEYSLKLKDDGRRYREVRRATSNPKHPFAKFSVGNLDTLGDKEGRPVLNDLRKFYANEYSASRMAVSVLGKESLDELEQKVSQKFGPVPNNNKGPSPATVPIFKDSQKGALIQLKPNAEKRSVELQFPAPPRGEHYDHRPVELITFILGHEGQGSLYQTLKEKGWAERLSAGDSGADDHVLFSIKIGLTQAGRENWKEVVALSMEMIRRLQKKPDLNSYFRERKSISELNFKYSEPAKPRNAVQTAVRRMLRFPQAHVLDLSSVYSTYEQDLIDTYLSHLTIDNMRVFLIAPDVTTDQIEPLYQTPYAIAPFDADLKSRWMKPIVDTTLALPQPNPYIAEKTTLKQENGAAVSQAATPQQEEIRPGLTLWRHLDTEFGVPRSMISIQIRSPNAGRDIQSRIYNEMFASLVNDSLESENYPMRLAGVSMGVSAPWTGLTLRTSGYDEKQGTMIKMLCKQVKSFSPDQKRFDLIKAKKLRAWKNLAKDRPIRIGGRAIDQLFYPRQFDRNKATETLASTTLEGFQAWRESYFDSGSIEAFVYGNQTPKEARAIANSTHNLLLKGADTWIRPPREIRRLPKGERSITLKIDHPDSVFLAKYQGASGDIEEQAKYRLLAHLMKASFFSELRTKQQLGYTVWAYSDLSDRIPGLRLSIQSAKKDPITIQSRVDAFLKSFQERLSNMAKDEYQEQIAGLVANLEEKDNAFYTRGNRLKRNIALDYTDFNHRLLLSKSVKAISIKNLNSFFDEKIINGDRVIVRAFGKRTEAEEEPSTHQSMDALMGDFTERFVREKTP